jgi:hypothetical protein
MPSVPTAQLYPKHCNFLEKLRKWINFLLEDWEFSRISGSGGPTNFEFGAAILGDSSEYGQRILL